MNPKVTNTDDYLATLPADQGAALQKLRKQILAAAPGCEEYFGYGLPGFKLHGRPLLYMGAAKNHCALYGMVPKGFEEALEGYTCSKGTIQFSPKKPIPAAVVKAIVKIKVAELKVQEAERAAKKEAKRTARKVK